MDDDQKYSHSLTQVAGKMPSSQPSSQEEAQQTPISPLVPDIRSQFTRFVITDESVSSGESFMVTEAIISGTRQLRNIEVNVWSLTNEQKNRVEQLIKAAAKVNNTVSTIEATITRYTGPSKHLMLVARGLDYIKNIFVAELMAREALAAAKCFKSALLSSADLWQWETDYPEFCFNKILVLDNDHHSRMLLSKSASITELVLHYYWNVPQQQIMLLTNVRKLLIYVTDDINWLIAGTALALPNLETVELRTYRKHNKNLGLTFL